MDDPLDTASFQDEPCNALTSKQAQDLGFPPEGHRRNMPLGRACEWAVPDDTGSVTVHFLDRYPYGLSSEYQANEDRKWAFFEELSPIEGYPAVSRGLVDGRDRGACTVVVGVSDEITFEVPITLSTENVGKKEPCEVAAMVAGLALETMKKG